jgi:hypothetical protein
MFFLLRVSLLENDRKSFEEAQRWFRELDKSQPSSTNPTSFQVNGVWRSPKILLNYKTEKQTVKYARNFVSSEEAREFASSNGMLYYECKYVVL